MIQITVKRNPDIISIEVKGHAGSADYGHDLVCAIVSGIITGLANALYEMVHEEDIVLEEGYAKIYISNPCDKSNTICETALYMLKTAQEVNKEYIKIMEV